MTNFLNELSSVKLRTVKQEEIKDYSDPKLAGFLTKSSIESYQSNVLECNFENWYEKLKDVTFRSEYLSLNLMHAELFVKIYPRIRTFKDEENWKKIFNKEELKLVNDLETRLDKLIENFIQKPTDYVFVKTSSRSAKDSPLTRDKFRDIYKVYLNELNENEKSSENHQIICLLKASFDSLKIQKASQVLEMFFRSERIYQDMLLAIEKKDRFNESFIIREYVKIDVDMEFRGFVFKRRLTALSQYNYLIYSKRLNEIKNQIQHEINSFFYNKVKNKLENFIENYIIDFAVFSNDKTLWCSVIEINPFLETTDGGLFSWEHEKYILQSDKEFCFRITERPKPGVKTMLPLNLRFLINS